MFGRLTAAFRALWVGLTAPYRYAEVSADSAVAIFAAAVLVLAATTTTATFIEAADPVLSAEIDLLARSQPQSGGGNIDLSSTQRQFTAVFGGALIRSIISVAVLAGMFYLLGRFLTNQPFTYSMSIGAVASAALIDVIQQLVYVPLHVLLHTSQAGAHLGAMVAPSQHPFLFAWLQRFDLFMLWQYVAIAMALGSATGLHRRYGYVVGPVIFLVVQLIFGGLTLVAWVTSRGV